MNDASHEINSELPFEDDYLRVLYASPPLSRDRNRKVNLAFAKRGLCKWVPGAVIDMRTDTCNFRTGSSEQGFEVATFCISDQDAVHILDGTLIVDIDAAERGEYRLVEKDNPKLVSPYTLYLRKLSTLHPTRPQLVVGFMVPYRLGLEGIFGPTENGGQECEIQLKPLAYVLTPDILHKAYYQYRCDMFPPTPRAALTVAGVTPIGLDANGDPSQEAVLIALRRVCMAYNHVLTAFCAAHQTGYDQGLQQPLRRGDYEDHKIMSVVDTGGQARLLYSSLVNRRRDDPRLDGQDRFKRFLTAGVPIWLKTLAEAKRYIAAEDYGLALFFLLVALEVRIDSYLRCQLKERFVDDQGTTKIDGKPYSVALKYTCGIKDKIGACGLHEHDLAGMTMALWQLTLFRNSFAHRASPRAVETDTDFARRRSLFSSIHREARRGEWDIPEPNRKICEGLHFQAHRIIEFVDSLPVGPE